ncbi:hypothetical protein SNOG_06785 [Parastagonospora nodorum SN15]|uniref:Uncharacterized protein n=1 Tax=Phaeosphaeria nodorum (strain SN15 / ATCC MYA-4574 / FGSC 10173) TaxID=321614 RepID=Q0UN79_PHANO|nr:hypothetical protein SNOG_06785 [Parastagonospora nodorum SN15]EAT85436.1 hypothetical protein SNOG_06785 [Parastagonospora nodorum SN15]
MTSPQDIRRSDPEADKLSVPTKELRNLDVEARHASLANVTAFLLVPTKCPRSLQPGPTTTNVCPPTAAVAPTCVLAGFMM